MYIIQNNTEFLTNTNFGLKSIFSLALMSDGNDDVRVSRGKLGLPAQLRKSELKNALDTCEFFYI